MESQCHRKLNFNTIYILSIMDLIKSFLITLLVLIVLTYFHHNKMSFLNEQWKEEEEEVVCVCSDVAQHFIFAWDSGA